MTVEDLKRQLELYKDDCEIEFSGLTFFRLKMRGKNLLNVEFAEIFEQLHNPETGQLDLILRLPKRPH